MDERVLVAGAGALGTVLGGFLRRSGMAVTLLGRAAHLDAIAREGLRIDGIWGEHHVAGFTLAHDAGELRGRFSAVLLTVKSFATRTMAQAVAPFLAEDGVMISLQNGLGNVEAVEEIAGAERALGGRVIFGSVLLAPGHARVTVFADPVLIGARRAGVHPHLDARARRWAEVFDRAGVPARYSENIESALWAKVFYNAALNPLGALLGVHYGALAESADGRAVMDAAIAEAFAVATAEGIPLAWPDAESYRREFYARLVPMTFHHRSSMLQDLERKRRTEIDAINGELWRRGAAHGIVTPVNELLTRLIRLRSGDHAAQPA